jgi:hypothetical protein
MQLFATMLVHALSIYLNYNCHYSHCNLQMKRNFSDYAGKSSQNLYPDVLFKAKYSYRERKQSNNKNMTNRSMNIKLIEQIYRRYERHLKKKQVYELMFSLKKKILATFHLYRSHPFIFEFRLLLWFDVKSSICRKSC